MELTPVYVEDNSNAVSLPDGPSVDTTISLPPPNSTEKPLPPEIAASRAAKTARGGIIDKTEDQMYEEYIRGNESMLRKEAATRKDFDRVMARNKAVQDLAAQKGGPLSTEEVMRIMDPFNPKNAPADVNDVIEKAYAEKSVSSLSTARSYLKENLLDSARVEMPNAVNQTLDEGADLLAKNQYIRTRMENTENNLVQKQSWPGYLADQAKTMFQPYVEYKERGLLEGSSKLAGIGLGSNVDEQHYQLYREPSFSEFKRKFDAAMDYLEKDNPSLAVEYAKKMLSQSTWESTLNNTFSAMAIPDYLAIGKVGSKLVGKANKINQVRKATADILDATAKDPSPEAAAAGAGDLVEASVQRVSKAIDDALQGKADPIAAAKDALMTTWIDDASKFMSNPGTFLSRELITRIQDGFARDGEDLINRIATMNRVERTPVAVTSQEVIRDYISKIKQEYKGPANTLLDVEGPIREPISGTYWYKSKIGNYDATNFPDLETAKGFANQIGLDEPIIKGQASDYVYLPQSAVMKREFVDGKTKNFQGEGLGDTKLVIDPDLHVQTGVVDKTTTPLQGSGVRFLKRNPDVVGEETQIIPSTRPEPGHIPYNLKTGKFEQPLTAQQVTAIEQQGLGFHIEVWTPMKENDDLIRDLMIKTKSGDLNRDAISTNSATGINSIKNSLLGWVRNSDDTLSVNESAQRKAVTYTQANIQLWAKQLYKDLEDVASGRVREDNVTGAPLSALTVYPKSWFGKLSSRKIAQEFERTLDHARRAVDPETGEPGYFFKTAGELQDHYQRNFRRDPSYLETKAYFNYTKLIEGDRIMAEVSEFRNRGRLGTEQHSISVTDAATGEKIQSPYFDGIKQVGFPGGEDYILIMGRNKGDETLYQLGHINDSALKHFREKVETGQAKVIQIYDRDHMPLDNFSEVAKGKLVSYVYTETAQSKPIEFNHVKRRGGGHFEWDYDHYLKQADIRPQYNTGKNNKTPGLEHLYVGDVTVMPIKNRQLGANVAKLWNEAQALIREKRWDEVKPIVAKLGIKYDEFTSWYHPGRDADGNPTRPRLNPNEPIVVVQRNKKISEMGSELSDRYRLPRADGSGFRETFRDATKSGPANNFKVAYNQERNSSFDMRTINDVGTQGNPIYAHQPAEMVDPLTTMNRALNRAINSTFMDDYKLYSVEHWLREAEPYLDASKNEIRSSPFFYFNNPKWRSGVDKTTIWNLESNRYKSQQFTGVPNKFDTWIHSLTSTLADNFYTKYGPEGSRSLGQKAVSVVPIWALHHVTDPVSFMRSVTFNFKLGLGAIPQFLVQAQTHSLIWALEPRHGTVGTYHTLLHAWASFTDNPRVLQQLDDMATKMNMFGSKARPGEFLEARRELQKSGFESVAGEYSNLNNQLKTKFIQNDFDKGLKIGQYPFRLGEQSTRTTAWYTAFREFRDANPTTPITNIERSQILQKADLLTVNMSRASSSALNHGVFSLSTQFLTYQIKLAELFWGKRLGETLAERNLARARMITVFAGLYGVPNALGVTGAPFSDNLREHFMDDLGYIPGEKWLSTMINEGLPAWQMAMITGKLDNFGDRFGSQGFQNVKQALRGDIPWWQAVGGAAVSTSANFLGSLADPFTHWASSLAKGQPSDSRFTIKAADLVEPLKEISSYSAATKWWAAMETGKWINKNEGYVTDVTPLHATLLALTGMQPQEQDDMFINNKMIKGEEQSKKAALKEFIKDWRRGIEAKQNNDDTQAIEYFNNAMARAAVVGMRPDEINTAIALGNKGYEKAIDSSDYSVWTKGDYNKQQQRLEQYKRKLKMKDEGTR